MQSSVLVQLHLHILGEWRDWIEYPAAFGRRFQPVMRRLSSVWFGYMPVWGISWLSIAVSIVLGLVTVLLAARSPAKFASRVFPLEAVTGSARRNTAFRHAANTRRWKVDVALGIHHAKAKRSSYILMTCAFAVCLTLFLGFCTLVPFMKNAFMPKEWAAELSIVSESNTCSIPTERRDDVAALPSVSRVLDGCLPMTYRQRSAEHPAAAT